LITQTWDYWLDRFPCEDIIDIPKPPLQSITHVKYYDTDNTESTFSNTKYTVDTNDTQGRVFLNDGYSWADGDSLRQFKGVVIRFVGGYGDVASDVPEEYKQAIKFLVGHFYENREQTSPSLVRDIKFDMYSTLGYDRNIPI